MEAFKMIDTISEEMKLKSALDRRIILSDEVTRDTIFKVKYFLEKLQKIDKMRPEEPLKPITIVIDSYGGEIYSGVSLIGMIEQYKDTGYQIITEVNGAAMSMGFMIALCGSKRTAVRYSRFMIHQPSSATWGTLREQQDSVAETEFLWNQMKSLIKKYSAITDEYLDKIYEGNKDVYLTPEQMVEFKALDIIY